MSTNVCNDQKTFNKAVKKAINHLDEPDNKNQAANLVMVLITLTFYVWALLLALKVQDKQHRLLHVLFALVFGPIYVLAYYASMINMDSFDDNSEIEF
jgi:hypothetical protein